jgi:hypothetical protein
MGDGPPLKTEGGTAVRQNDRTMETASWYSASIVMALETSFEEGNGKE